MITVLVPTAGYDLSQAILNAPQPRKVCVLLKRGSGGQRHDNREMQKTSYSTRTRGTIPTAPTVNALVIHRRLQLKDRVRTGVEDLLSGFANSKGAGHGKTNSMCKYGDVARMQPQAPCKWRTHRAEVSELGSSVRHVQIPSAPHPPHHHAFPAAPPLAGSTGNVTSDQNSNINS